MEEEFSWNYFLWDLLPTDLVILTLLSIVVLVQPIYHKWTYYLVFSMLVPHKIELFINLFVYEKIIILVWFMARSSARSQTEK